MFFFHSNTLQLFYMIHLIPGEFDINVFSTISTSHSMTEWRCKYKGQTTLPTCCATGSRMLSMVFVWNTGILNNPESRNTTSYKCSQKTYHVNTSVLPSDRNNQITSIRQPNSGKSGSNFHFVDLVSYSSGLQDMFKNSFSVWYCILKI